MNTLDGVDARRANVNPVLTIIITCYNTRDIVRDCLHSIYKHPPSETYEIILVDDASTDGTSEMVRATFPEIRLLRNESNQNYSSSNNRALDEARGEFVLLLNNDTLVPPLAFELDDRISARPSRRWGRWLQVAQRRRDDPAVGEIAS